MGPGTNSTETTEVRLERADIYLHATPAPALPRTSASGPAEMRHRDSPWTSAIPAQLWAQDAMECSNSRGSRGPMHWCQALRQRHTANWRRKTMMSS